MKITLLLFIAFYGAIVTLPPQYCNSKIEKNGMLVSWKFQEDRIHFEVEAPTHGWVAIGFNYDIQLKGTNLIMGVVKNGKLNISDRYIVGVGNHKVMEKIGSTSQLENLKGMEEGDKTILSFSLPIDAADEFHFDLKKGRTIHLLMAFSSSDDFQHHSMMRTSTEIIL